ncbi:hypothetical protein [Alkalimarinus coralli]|uniref:hypothetical protein n=1 Tax=Alkalimarinus coralli TaxID=2935863 RepID=UPI00202B5B4B|nr:hypothetical protein [Alkalimarinus coralli]
MRKQISNIISWLIVLWIAKVFLLSLPYKFSGHPDTQHIFGTIGLWMKETLGHSIGNGFIQYGAYTVGTVELIISLILLAPALIWLIQKNSTHIKLPSQHTLHGLGGLMAAGVMCGAVFFHLATPLGIEVLHKGKSDNGSLFYAAVSIIFLGATLSFISYSRWTASSVSQSSVQLE